MDNHAIGRLQAAWRFHGFHGASVASTVPLGGGVGDRAQGQGKGKKGTGERGNGGKWGKWEKWKNGSTGEARWAEGPTTGAAVAVVVAVAPETKPIRLRDKKIRYLVASI